MRILFATLFAVLVFAVLAASCDSVAQPKATSAPMRTGGLIGSPGWPRHPRIVGTIKAALPGADSITQSKRFFLAAYAKACRDVTVVRAVFGRFKQSGLYGPRSRVMEVRCEAARAVGVRVIFTGVMVPRFVGLPPVHQPSVVTNMLGLRLKIVTGAAKPGQLGGHVIRQRPAPGLVVPFGTTLVLVEVAVT